MMVVLVVGMMFDDEDEDDDDDEDEDDEDDEDEDDEDVAVQGEGGRYVCGNTDGRRSSLSLCNDMKELLVVPKKYKNLTKTKRRGRRGRRGGRNRTPPLNRYCYRKNQLGTEFYLAARG